MINKKITENESSEEKHFDLLAGKYDRNYDYYNPFTRYKIDRKVKEFKSFVSKNRFKGQIKIIEFGCGTGEYTLRIAKAFPTAKITAIDISKGILKIAKIKCKKYKNVSFAVQSAYKTKYENGQFDVGCGFYFLHHVKVKEFAREIRRLLKVGGAGFFYEPNIFNPLVYLIKSSQFLKKLVGDSPHEWGINPVRIVNYFPGFSVATVTTEFIYPFKFIPFAVLKSLDKVVSVFSAIPLVNYFGGSVVVKLFKDKTI